MDNKAYNIRVPKRWARLTMIVGVTALIVAPLTAVATHSFDDVPNSHTFHDDIAWLKDADVTRGCNPPANNLYCPDDNVTRGQMAAFMLRLSQYMGAEDGTPAQADNATTADQADNATTADTADVANTVADGAVGTNQIAIDAAGVAVAGVGTFTTGTEVRNWFNRFGSVPIIDHTGVGQYDVTFPGLEGQLDCDAIVLVTVVGFSGFASNSGGCGGLDTIEVQTFGTNGLAADRSYSIVIMTPGVPGGFASESESAEAQGE